MNNRLKFLIIDDHPIVIDGMTMAFQSIDPHAQILTAPSVDQALINFGHDEQFALIMLALTLQDEQDFTLLSALKTAMIDVPIVLYSADERVNTVYRALDSGAMGFISKRSQTAVLVGALRLVLAGGIYIPPQILTAMQTSPPSFASSAQEHVSTQVQTPTQAHTQLQAQFLAQLLELTERQIDVLNLLVQGKPNKIICRELQIAEGTAKSHISAIMRALKVKNRTQVSAVINQFSINVSSDIRKNIKNKTQKIDDTNTISNDISCPVIPLHSEKNSVLQNNHRHLLSTINMT